LLEGEGLQPSSDTETLARILNRTASLLQARGCGVFLWDRDKNTLSAMKPFSGMEDARLAQLEFPVGNSVMGAAVLQDRPVLLEDTGNGHVDAQILRQFNIQNAVTVPLALERRDENNEIVQRELMGVYCAFDKFYGRSFDMEDARLLSMMARQASAVLVTSKLYWQQAEISERLRSVLESTSVGLLAVSAKGTITQVNPAARLALGISTDGWFGRSYQEIIQQPEINALISDALMGNPPEAPREINLVVHPEDDEPEERIYRIQADPIQADEQRSMGWVTVFENITDIRRAEQLMAAMVDMVSHELRTPLTSIRGFVATLLQAGEGIFDWETQEEFLQIVDIEAERLGQMIDDLLNIARIQNGKSLQYTFMPVDLNRVASQVVRLQSQSPFMKGQHQLISDIPDDLPQLNADEGKLTQILHNLVSNALKYSPNGGEVKLAARPHDGGILLVVSDQGLGIPPEQLPKMFGQFFRVDSSKHTGIKGTGLGLWLTKHMVEEGHRGRIWVESDYGHGSQFKVWLPLDPDAHGDSGEQ
jgi:PAS domain S-box-containing protein